MRWSDRRISFRTLLAGSECIYPASVFDPMSARIAQDIGFEIGMLSGSIASYAILGAPDLLLITLTELAEQALRINRAGHLPLLVDADNGYGNALNVMRTVQELETAGVAAICIEDTILPITYGEKKPALLSMDESVAKLRAALAARGDAELVIFGRTSAHFLTSVSDAVARAKAYEAAGVDGLFLAGPMTHQQLDIIAAAVSLPIAVAGQSNAILDRSYLSSRGVRIALQSHQPFMAAVQAAYCAYKALREGGDPDAVSNTASEDLMARVSRFADYQAWRENFLGHNGVARP